MGAPSLWKGLNLPKALLETEMETMIVTAAVTVAVIVTEIVNALVDMEEVQGDLGVVVTVLSVVSLDTLLVNVHLMMEAGAVVGMGVEGKEKVAATMDLIVVEIAVEIGTVEAVEVGVDVTEILVVVEGMEMIGIAVIVLAHMRGQELVAIAKVGKAVQRMLALQDTRQREGELFTELYLVEDILCGFRLGMRN